MSSAVADRNTHVAPSASALPAAELELRADRRTSIVYFVPQLTVGGMETQLAELVLHLDRTRFVPIIWLPGPWGPVGDRLKRQGVPVCRFRVSTRMPVSFLQAVRWLRRIRPTIFHSFGYADHWLDVLAARWAGIPICITCRQNVRHWDLAHRLRWSERLRNRWTDVVVANSRAVAATCAEIEHVPREQIRVIYNGVELGERRSVSEFRRQLGLGASDLLVGNVANLKRVKGQDVLLHAFQEVLSVIPHVYLLIFGEGEERDTLHRLCEQLGLAGHVLFLGLREDLTEIYPSLDLYVHSSHAEGLPTSILEAMAYGLPVAATAVGGTPELFLGNAEECLVPPRDPSALAHVILQFLRDPAMRRAWGATNRRRVAAAFQTARMVAEYESLYSELQRTKGAYA
jgi:glycosyltransferase involved in cell wall biosynthesis